VALILLALFRLLLFSVMVYLQYDKSLRFNAQAYLHTVGRGVLFRTYPKPRKQPYPTLKCLRSPVIFHLFVVVHHTHVRVVSSKYCLGAGDCEIIHNIIQDVDADAYAAT